jgi:hypothetical protein
MVVMEEACRLHGVECAECDQCAGGQTVVVGSCSGAAACGPKSECAIEFKPDPLSEVVMRVGRKESIKGFRAGVGREEGGHRHGDRRKSDAVLRTPPHSSFPSSFPFCSSFTTMSLFRTQVQKTTPQPMLPGQEQETTESIRQRQRFTLQPDGLESHAEQ